LNFSGFAFGQWHLSFIVPLLPIFTSTLFSCIISQSEKSISFRGSTETCFLTKLFFFVYR
jgi:hypothetical protein